MSTLGDRIKELRGTYTQKWLAEKMDIPPTTLSNYENNKSELNFATIQALKTIFQFDTDWLLFGYGSKEASETATAPAQHATEATKASPPENWAKQLAVANERLYQAWEREREMQKEIGELKAENARQQERIASLEARLEERQVMIDGLLELHKGGADGSNVDSAPPCAPFKSHSGREFNEKE